MINTKELIKEVLTDLEFYNKFAINVVQFTIFKYFRKEEIIHND